MTEENQSKGPLAATAAAIGAALGTIAGRTGLAHAEKPARKVKGKFVAQEKHRLPRKEKKKLRAGANSRG